MQEFLIYNLKSAACLTVFFLFYKLLLSRETFHSLNRAILLSAVALSFILPAGLVTLQREAPSAAIFNAPPAPMLPTTTSAEAMLPALPAPDPTDVITGPNDKAHKTAKHIGERLMAALFLAGAGAALLRWLASLARITAAVGKGERVKVGKRIVLVKTDRETVPFSWMRYIVLSRRDFGEYGPPIITHEAAHLRRGHSLDLLLFDIAGILQWFNPAMWLMRQSIRSVHEYEADREVLRSGFDAREYQKLLIKKAAGAGRYSIADSLNHSKLKNRVTMMLQKESGPGARLKVLVMLPLAAIGLTAFANREFRSPQGKDRVKVLNTDYCWIMGETPDGTEAHQMLMIENVSPTVTPPYLMVDVGIANTPYYSFQDMDYELGICISPAENADWPIPNKRFYIDLKNRPDNFTLQFSSLPDLVTAYIPGLVTEVPVQISQAPVKLTIRRQDGIFRVSADISAVPETINGIGVEKYSYSGTQVLEVDMDRTGRLSLDGKPATIDWILDSINRKASQEGIDFPGDSYSHYAVNLRPEEDTLWGDILAFRNGLRAKAGFIPSFPFSNDIFPKMEINLGIESGDSLYMNMESPHMERRELVPYYVYFTRRQYGTDDPEQLRKHLIEITMKGNKIFVNGEPTPIGKIRRKIEAHAGKAGKPIADMIIGIKTDNETKFGTIQRVKFYAGVLKPKWLVHVLSPENMTEELPTHIRRTVLE